MNWKRALTDEELLEAMRFNLWAHMIYADEQLDPFAIGIHTYSCIHTLFRSRGISGRGLLEPALDVYTGPTLIVWGEHDVTCTPKYLMTHMIEGHANRRGVILPDVGHWVNFEDAARVDPILIDWFGA